MTGKEMKEYLGKHQVVTKLLLKHHMAAVLGTGYLEKHSA